MTRSPVRGQSAKDLLDDPALLRTLLDGVPDHVYVKDTESRYVFNNAGHVKALGAKSPEEAIGKTDFDFYPKELARRYRANERELLRSGRPLVDREEPSVDGVGNERWHSTTKVPLRDGNGEIVGLVGVTRDVTERKRAIEARRKGEAKFRAVFDRAAIGMALVDEAGRVAESNRTLQEMLGYDEELRGMHFADVTHPDDVAADAELFEGLVAGKLDHFRLEKRYIRKDGSMVWGHQTSSAVRTAEGEQWFMIGMVEDITERKRIEEALKESEGRFRQLFERSIDALFVHDEEGRIADCNSEACRSLGYAREELLELSVGDIATDLLSEEEKRKKRGETLWERAVQGEPGEIVGFEENELRRKDGTTFPVEVGVGAIEYNGQHLIFASARDVTKRKRAEEALKESEERYRAVMQQSVEAIYLFDSDSKRVVETNPAFEELIGYTATELCEMTIYDFVAHERDDIDRNVRLHVVEERRFVGERRYRRKDGKFLEVEVSATLIPYRDGEAVCVVVRDVTERKALEEQLRHQAFHDPLTELPNRALFLDRLEHALARACREGASVAVLFIDLDDFKVVNDSLGHDAGNVVLVEVAERLRSCVRPGDTVARIFGDEFALLLEAPASVEDAHRVTRRIRDILQVSFDVKGREVFVSTSVGIATGDPARDRPDDLLRHADLAMFEAKSHGKGRYEVFVPSMSTRATERLDLERDLRRAVERDEFEVHYQPIIDLRTGEIVAFEALARWRHPERGLLAAADFIRLAEETGLIRPIGRLVLEEACRRAKEWGEGRADGTPSMSVNLSASQFARQPDMIPEVLTGTGLDPRRLQLEITERTVMHNAEFALGKLRRLKGLGVSFAIDDYGKGYSCLYYLKRMPVDSLKIDRAFITGLGENPDDTAIVSATIGLGHVLGLQVVAEGVESAEQLAELRKLGCDLAQGYHFAEPLSGEAAERLLAGDTTW